MHALDPNLQNKISGIFVVRLRQPESPCPDARAEPVFPPFPQAQRARARWDNESPRIIVMRARMTQVRENIPEKRGFWVGEV